MMKRVALFRFTALGVCAVVTGCDRSAEPEPAATAGARADSAQVTSAPAGAGGPSGAPCPRTGLWAICSLERRLEQSGFVLRKAEGVQPRRSGFSVQPEVYTLGRARLEVFVYPDEAALSRDVAKMDTALVALRGQRNDWEIPPRFVRSVNMVAVFLTRNEQQAERLTLAITAGAPH